ncbi:MAG: tetratricopeptide repeat protein, partial [Bacteroidales bacterium]
MRNSRYLHIILIILFAASIFPSCSTKKNTPATRHYQSFITRYNVYYNGDKHYIEQIDKMENSYQDDYSSGRVYIHPVEALTNSKAPQPGTNYDRTIEKMQKAIQLHSIKISPKRDRNKMRDPRYREYVKRGEFNPFIHNAWYLMAQAQYYNGDFLGASSTFKYIAKNFTWMPELVTNCTLWEMRSYTTMGWMTEASNIAERIKPTDIITTENREIYNITFADYYLKEGKIKEAVPFLENAINDTNKGQHTRLNFLLGEVYAEIGDNPKAYAAFQQAAKSSSATYRTKFNARIKQSEVFSKADISTEVKSLKRMTNYDRNKEYLDQIYYAIANLHLTRGDTANAVSNYILSIEKSTRNGIDKALSQIKLGELYYETQQYDLAQPCYTEAVPQLPETFLNYAQIKLRSEILDELAVFAQNVTLQDSLLTLSAMTPEEQTKVAERLIAELEKQEKEQQEEMARQEFIAQQAAQGNNRPNQNNAPTTFQVSSSDNSWYFYNSSTKSAGKTEFQKRWGSRKLEDNWRRINKTTFSMDEFDESNYDEDGNLIDNQD